MSSNNTPMELWNMVITFTDRSIIYMEGAIDELKMMDELKKKVCNRAIVSSRKMDALLAYHINGNANISELITVIENVSDEFMCIDMPPELTYFKKKQLQCLISSPNIDISQNLKLIGDKLNIAKDKITGE